MFQIINTYDKMVILKKFKQRIKFRSKIQLVEIIGKFGKVLKTSLFEALLLIMVNVW